ncbi:ISL3 family transposase [Enterococcus sp. LJL98]
MVCLDDFSLRKRHTYGSILIDYQSKKVMDLLPSRSQKHVSDWLAIFPNITFVIRDGSTAFRNAISTACPDAIQISDRFHLLKSLTDHGIAAIHSLIPDKIKMSSFDSRPSTSYIQPIKQYSDSQLRKQKMITLVKEKREIGWNFTQIARYFHLDPRTVKRYCENPLSNLVSSIKKERYTRLDEFHELFFQLAKKFQTLQPLYDSLVLAGYDRTFDTFRKTYRQVLKKQQITGKTEMKVHKRSIKVLLFKNKLDWDSLSFVSLRVLKENTKLLSIIELVISFRKILNDTSLMALDDWIHCVRKNGNKELNAFVNGLERDKDAVQNTIIFPELSNGLAEGKINKLKTIKRIMFGRCHFQTLKLKMILSDC